MCVLLAAMLETAPVQVVSIRAEAPAEAAPRVTVEATGNLADVSVKREGDKVRISIGVAAREDVQAPAAVPPIDAIELVRSTGRMDLVLGVGEDVPYTVQRGTTSVVLVFDAAAENKTQRTAEALARYRRLFPPRDEGTATDLSSVTPPRAPSTPGIHLGPFQCQPALLLGYVNTKTPAESAAGQQDSYFQLEPRLGCNFALEQTLETGIGRFHASYTPRVRSRSHIDRINRWSHELSAGVQIPIGARFRLRGADHFAIGTLEAQEVDPGREYFFDLGKFRRNRWTGTFEAEVGSRMMLSLGAASNDVRFTETAAFFGFRQDTQQAGLEFKVSEATMARLQYTRDRIPPPKERPLAAMDSNTYDLVLTGEVLPLVESELTIGYQDKSAPEAGEGGRRFTGLVTTGRVTKKFTRGTKLALRGSRATYPSAHESDAFYVDSAAQAALDFQLPLRFSARAGGGRLWNDYQAVTLEIGGPRRDRIWAWTAGLGRELTRWAFLRADYIDERRDSNVNRFDSHNHTLVVQFGVGFFGSTAETE